MNEKNHYQPEEPNSGIFQQFSPKQQQKNELEM